MNISRISANGNHTGTGTATTLSIAGSTLNGYNVPGNFILMQCGGNNATTVTHTVTVALAGGGTRSFTTVPGFTPQTAGNVCLQRLLYYIPQGDESGNLVVTASSATRFVANYACYANVNLVDPFAGIAQQNDGVTTSLNVAFPTASSGDSPAYAVLLGRTRNGTSVQTVDTVSTGFTVATDVCTTGTSFNQGFIADQHTDYTGTPPFNVVPGTTTVTPNSSSTVEATVLLNALTDRTAFPNNYQFAEGGSGLSFSERIR